MKLTWIRDIIIEIERWNFRRKQKKMNLIDADKMVKAILKANQKSEKTKKRLWVLKFAPGEYQILTKGQVKAFFRKIKPLVAVNFYHQNEYVIHITKKPE